jgi:hypothetical protein
MIPRVGVQTDYFAAASDEAAAAFVEHGPAHAGLSGDEEIGAAFRAAQQAGDREALRAVFRPRVQAAPDGMPVMRSKGILPAIQLDKLEALLTGRSYEEITAGPRSSADVASTGGGDTLVLTVTDELQHVLATADESRLAEVAVPWMESDKLLGRDSAALTNFLTALAELARQATSRNERLYCWVSP